MRTMCVASSETVAAITSIAVVAAMNRTLGVGLNPPRTPMAVTIKRRKMYAAAGAPFLTVTPAAPFSPRPRIVGDALA